MMKYYSKRFISVLLMVCMLLAGFPTQAFAIESANYTLNYTANGDSTVTITGISVAEGFEEADLAVEIPETIDGMTVTKIEGTRWTIFSPEWLHWNIPECFQTILTTKEYRCALTSIMLLFSMTV